MQLLLALLILASPIILFLGLIKPTLFKRWLGDQAKRSSIVGLSLALFIGSAAANGVLYPQTLVTEQAETVITPPTLPKETPQVEDQTEPEENTVPKNNAIERTPSIETPQSEPEEEPKSELEPEPIPAPVISEPSSSTYNCSDDKYNCGDFSTCSEVMSVFSTCSNDINGLDGDNDGVPCESLCE